MVGIIIQTPFFVIVSLRVLEEIEPSISLPKFLIPLTKLRSDMVKVRLIGEI